MRLIATDLDGTLLQRDSTISTDDLNAIIKAEEQGIKVVVATGRQYTSAKSLLKNCKFEPDYMICDNGSTIYSVKDDKKLCSFPLHKDKIIEILNYLNKNDYYYSLSSDTCRVELKNFAEKLKSEFERNKKRIPDLNPFHLTSLIDLIDSEGKDRSNDVDCSEDIINLDMNFYNITAISFDPERIEQGIEGASKIPGISVVSSAYNNFEMLHEHASKGSALEYLANHLGVTLDETMAIGDNFNDLSMLQKATHSVAMGNASDDIKKICKYVTLDNSKSGVGHAIMNFAIK
ncbi:Cof-type HAD-IIB family hydrolase [Clostridium paraputrificum]|uniref:Cof-type HAD-IIB family hydrolase n=1 Tax=Clostridium TaxID=1485 RepID=UPI003D328A1F